MFRKLDLKQSEFDILLKQKKIIIEKAREIDEDINIYFNEATNVFTVEALCNDSLELIMAMVQKKLIFSQMTFDSKTSYKSNSTRDSSQTTKPQESILKPLNNNLLSRSSLCRIL